MEISSICVICGKNHEIPNCDLVTITNHITDNERPSKAKLTLPAFLHIRKQTDNTQTVVTRQSLEKGTKFGPLLAPHTPILTFQTNFPLKIFPTEHFLDFSDENQCNWMIFVQFADNYEEQNLICYQEINDIYYVTNREISENEELKVWYSPYYAKKINKLIFNPEIKKNHQVDVADLIKNQQNLVNQQWNCKFCSKIEENVVLFAKHLIKHYLAELKPTCDLCNAVFHSRKNLKSHLKTVHYQQISQNKRKKPQIQQFGGPLLGNDIFSDSLLDLSLNQFDLTDLIPQDFDYSDNLLLNDNFNFDLLNSNDKQFTCDICMKQFTKINLLLLHLKRHTGDFLCEMCLKIFCRKENLKNHLCNLLEFFTCYICDRKFTQKKYLTRHVKLHSNKFVCLNYCNKSYTTKKELDEHNCCMRSVTEKEQFLCHLCNKSFLRKLYLKRHLKVHENIGRNLNYICEICGKHLKNKTSLYLHKKVHGTHQFSCDVCKKSFTRKDSLNCHKKVHETVEKKFQCDECCKKFKSVKILKMHLNNNHKPNKIFKCPICGKLIKLKSSLLRHLRNVHSKPGKITDVIPGDKAADFSSNVIFVLDNQLLPK